MEEVKRIFLDFLRKQGGTVLVLAAGCWLLYTMQREQKNDLEARIQLDKTEYQKTIQVVSSRLDDCESARVNLVAEVERLKVQVQLLIPTRRK